MSWTCSRCATDHGTPELRRACRRAERRLALLAVMFVIAVGISVIGVRVALSAYAYGDWKCAFIECRKLVK